MSCNGSDVGTSLGIAVPFVTEAWYLQIRRHTIPGETLSYKDSVVNMRGVLRPHRMSRDLYNQHWPRKVLEAMPPVE